jgi:hypothetical protein
MGPITLFDKSFLESLNPDEAVWFDHFFLANVCPMFYVETQSDLAKEGSDRGTPEELVSKLANKFPDFSGSPNVHHTTICTANLLGEDVPMRGQVLLPRGCNATVSGHPMAILPESPEAKAFLRWTQGDYEEEERQAAAEWRTSDKGYGTDAVIEALTKLKIDLSKSCSSLANVRAMTDEVLAALTSEQQLYLAMQLLGINTAAYGVQILLRFKTAGEPAFSTFAPYVDFCLRVELFFHLAVFKSQTGTAERTDLCYLFYLPFCQIFVSGDWVHKKATSLFLRPDQEFVSAEKMKAALRALNAYYLALPEEERRKSIHQMAPQPPKDGDNLITQLWDRHFKTWRTPKTVKVSRNDMKEVTSFWQDKIAELQNIAETTGGDATPIPIEGLDALIMRRKARKRKGSWWLVPEELRRREPPQLTDGCFEFNNGATADNIVDQEIQVYIRTDEENIPSMTGCRTYLSEGQLWVDCAPPLKRTHIAPMPRGAMIARSTDHRKFAAFVRPKTELGLLVTRLWEDEEKRRGGKSCPNQ